MTADATSPLEFLLGTAGTHHQQSEALPRYTDEEMARLVEQAAADLRAMVEKGWAFWGDGWYSMCPMPSNERIPDALARYQTEIRRRMRAGEDTEALSAKFVALAMTPSDDPHAFDRAMLGGVGTGRHGDADQHSAAQRNAKGASFLSTVGSAIAGD